MDDTGASFLQAYRAHVQDTVGRLGDATDGVRSAAQDYQTEIGNKQGDRINQLTIVSMIFLPVTFLTGYFGMNFQWLNNETQSFGIWLFLGLAIPILIVIQSIIALSHRGFTIRLRRQPDRKSASDAI